MSFRFVLTCSYLPLRVPRSVAVKVSDWLTAGVVLDAVRVSCGCALTSLIADGRQACPPLQESPRWCRRCRAQRRRIRRSTVRWRRVTTSGVRRERPSWTTTCRSTFFDTERRSCLRQRRRDDCPMRRPLVLCRKQSARRARSSRSRSSLHSW